MKEKFNSMKDFAKKHDRELLVISTAVVTTIVIHMTRKAQLASWKDFAETNGLKFAFIQTES